MTMRTGRARVAPRDEGDGAAEPERHLGRHGGLVGDAADAVGAEELARRRARCLDWSGFRLVTEVHELQLDAEVFGPDEPACMPEDRPCFCRSLAPGPRGSIPAP